MRVIILSWALSMMFIAIGAEAAQEIGNGGDAIVCGPSGQAQVEMLDTYIARDRLGLHPGLGTSHAGLTYQEIVTRMLDRLESVNDSRARQYRQWNETFFAEAELRAGIVLTDVPDGGGQVIPAGCVSEQIAVQREANEMMPGEKRYTINKDLWDRMDNFNKAALVIHELVYRERLSLKVKGSRFVRHFTAHIISEEMSTVDLQMLAIINWLETYDANGEHVRVEQENEYNEWMHLKFTSFGTQSVSLNFTSNPAFANRYCAEATLDFTRPMTWPLSNRRVRGKDCTGGPLGFDIFVGGAHYTALLKPADLIWELVDSVTEDGESYAGELRHDLTIPSLQFECQAGERIHFYMGGKSMKCSTMSWPPVVVDSITVQ